MQTYRARRVLRRERRGSSMPVLVQTDAGLFVTKLRGAVQGVAALVAELIVARLAEALGLRVPARVLIDLAPGLTPEAPDVYLRALLQASPGLNLGFQHMPDALDLKPDDVGGLDPDEAAAVLWLDGLVMNPDRTPNNPNLLRSQGHLWLIDHGAALWFHHHWAAVTEASPRLPFGPTTHVLGSWADRAVARDARFAALLGRDVLRAAVAAVPHDWLRPTLPLNHPPDPALARRREAYVAFLWKRLQPPRPFL